MKKHFTTNPVHRAARLAIIAGCCLLPACGEQPSTPASSNSTGGTSSGSTAASPDNKPAATPATPQSSTITAGAVTIKVPDGWTQSPPSNPMRLAELVVADEAGDAAKTCLTTISIAGGDIASNIARWAGQIKDASGQPARSEPTVREIGGFKVHLVEMHGSYQGMTDPAPLPDWTIRGAIIESGEQMVFIKSTGPTSNMEKITTGWNALVDSISRK